MLIPILMLPLCCHLLPLCCHLLPPMLHATRRFPAATGSSHSSSDVHFGPLMLGIVQVAHLPFTQRSVQQSAPCLHEAPLVVVHFVGQHLLNSGLQAPEQHSFSLPGLQGWRVAAHWRHCLRPGGLYGSQRSEQPAGFPGVRGACVGRGGRAVPTLGQPGRVANSC